ncbi:MAG: ATP-dependent sacrificial sulfur transferase LarE [Candidatus Omnitrophica bacterium]|nr:ATP-dependent sacrificial sulfur transferase LarE [Candidatus Omnitrophota bacterium]
MSLKAKLEKLRFILKNIDSALVAFSGGVDSSFLLAVCEDTLGKKTLAVTGISPAISGSEVVQAKALAKKLKARHILIKENPSKQFWENSPLRCYYCKKALFGRLKKLAGSKKLSWVIEGSNADDSRDYRPGSRALKELNIRSPLKEAGLTKKDIRLLSFKFGLKSWNKPAMACLASRIPYGEKITPLKLERVGRAEDLMRKLGFSQVRVRLSQDAARVEVEPGKISALVKKRKIISAGLKSLGFTYASIDLDGYRTGSMNEALGWKQKR